MVTSGKCGWSGEGVRCLGVWDKVKLKKKKKDYLIARIFF